MLKEAIKVLDETHSSDRLEAFYDRIDLEAAHMLSYKDQLQIFGKYVDYNHLLDANKRLLQSHFQFYNAAFDSLWKYKYPLLVLRCLYLGGTLFPYQSRAGRPRSPSTGSSWWG